nr:2605_t:CDS:2 [Entrophospora candida]
MIQPKKLKITVPCTSANIGPGFDVLGVTFSLYLHVTVEILDTKNNTANANVINITYSGEGEDSIPLTADKNLITKTALYVLACNSISNLPCSLNIHIDNNIPLGRGLGSSGAAVVAGVMLGDVIGKLGLTKDRMLDYCLMIEHHPDNVTAALMGGFIASYLNDLDNQNQDENIIHNSEVLSSSNKGSSYINNGGGIQEGNSMPNVPYGRSKYIRLNWAIEIKAIVVIPQYEVPTAISRSVLPSEYKKEDLIFNLQRLAVLTTALSQSPPNPDLIFQAMQDKIHQPYRKDLVPGLSEILTSIKPKTHPGLLGICLSGAGPTILALATHNFDDISTAITNIFSEKKIQTVVRVLDVINDGATVVELDKTTMEGSKGPDTQLLVDRKGKWGIEEEDLNNPSFYQEL